MNSNNKGITTVSPAEYQAFTRMIQGILFRAADHLDAFAYGLRAYFLLGTTQTRIFMLTRNVIHHDIWCPPPEEGRFAALAIRNDEMIIEYSEYKEGEFISTKIGALAYKHFELEKADKHIADWLFQAIMPVADNVVGEIKPSFARGVPTALGGHLSKVCGPFSPTTKLMTEEEAELDERMRYAEATGQYNPWKEEE